MVGNPVVDVDDERRGTNVQAAVRRFAVDVLTPDRELQVAYDDGAADPSMIREEITGSVIIPAHNEANVIGRCIDSLLDGLPPDSVDITVVCNGCTDTTAEVARSRDPRVRVLEIRQASKPAAIRAAEQASPTLPRIFLDADVILPGASARAVLLRLSGGGIAARPPIRYAYEKSSWPVRHYYRGRSQIPAVMNSLWGAGVYGLSSAGRARFEQYPDIVAEDLWIDQHFAPEEIDIVDCPPVIVMVPRTSRDLLKILRRTYRGKTENKRSSGSPTRTADSTARDLLKLTRSGPNGVLDVLVYVGFAVTARLLARLADSSAWERDESSRRD